MSNRIKKSAIILALSSAAAMAGLAYAQPQVPGVAPVATLAQAAAPAGSAAGEKSAWLNLGQIYDRLVAAGYTDIREIERERDGYEAKARDAVHILYAGEKVRQADPFAAPRIDESEATDSFRVVALESLLRMKLTSYRRKVQVHIQDMIEVGLVDESWLARVPESLAGRPKEPLENPDG